MSHTSTLARRLARIALTSLSGLLVLVSIAPGSAHPGSVHPGSAHPAPVIGYSPLVDAPSSYEPQSTCTKGPRPGTVALAAWLQRTYRATGSLGLMRACSSGGISEHKDGRAFDWAADVARPATRAAAYDFIHKLLATDSAGNPDALARRMGIMYFIYNDTIWGSYRDFTPRRYLNSSCRTRRHCSRTLRHLNHMHISLGFAGAAAQTSWYRSRGVASQPVYYPGTHDLNPDETAVTGFSVPATGALTSSPFSLAAGVTYRIVVTGTVQYATGASGDATCTGGTPWTLTDRLDPSTLPRWLARSALPGDWGPPPTGSTHADSPATLPVPTTHGLTLQGSLRWEGDCSADHTYEAWYTPTIRQRLQLAYVDVPTTDNAGTFTVYVARDDITTASLARQPSA